MNNPLTYFQQYTLFADACDIPKGKLNDRPNFAAISLAKRLVDEEWNKETLPALLRFENSPSLENLAEVADGIADTVYVLCQLSRALGIDLDAVFAEVQRSNMLKVVFAKEEQPDGSYLSIPTVRRREDGKVLKPEGWEPPRILQLLFQHSNAEALAEGSAGTENWQEYKKSVQKL